MKRLLSASFLALAVIGTSRPAVADEKEANAILDKAIKAIGVDEKTAKDPYSWNVKGVLSFGGNESELKGTGIIDGAEKHRAELTIEGNNGEFKVLTVMDGNKGWRKFGENVMPLDDDGLAEEKRNTFRAYGVSTIYPFKASGVKVDTAGEEMVDGKPAVIVKITPADGKDFKVSFSKESGLPVRTVAQVKNFMGEDVEQEIIYKTYKEFKGRKHATKIEMKHNGMKIIDEELSDFKVLDKVEPGTFDEPK